MWLLNWLRRSKSKPASERSGNGRGEKRNWFCCSKPEPRKGRSEGDDVKKVVIIGGGIGGATVAYQLQCHAQVTLIDSKEYLEIPWANVRAFVEPSFAERTLINHREFLPNVRTIVSSAVDVTDSEVAVADGERIEYNYLVVATGHVGYASRIKAEKLSYYQSEFEKISSARSILIIGGGPAGVELAGEIAVEFPDKELTLVHRGSRLLEFIGAKASKKTLKWLTSKKVEVLLNQSIDMSNASEGIYKTSHGETITADCHFVCTGLPMGSNWLHDTVLKDSLDIQGRLMVDDKMRVRGRKNVFAVGHVTDIEEIKLGHLAQNHARVTAKNIKVMLMDGKENTMAKYQPGYPVAVVSLGRYDAVAQFRLITMIGRLPGLLKSKDLYVGNTRKLLGLDSATKDKKRKRKWKWKRKRKGKGKETQTSTTDKNK